MMNQSEFASFPGCFPRRKPFLKARDRRLILKYPLLR